MPPNPKTNPNPNPNPNQGSIFLRGNSLVATPLPTSKLTLKLTLTLTETPILTGGQFFSGGYCADTNVTETILIKMFSLEIVLLMYRSQMSQILNATIEYMLTSERFDKTASFLISISCFPFFYIITRICQT